MNWPYLRRGDMAGLLFVAVFCAAVAFVLLLFPQRVEQNFGFGPEWQCTRMEQGDPICVKLVDKGAADGNLHDKGASR